jgi:hypothetical protein
VIDLDIAPEPPPHRGRVPRHVAWGLSGVALGVVATLAVGEVRSAREQAAVPSRRASPGPSPTHVDRRFLAEQADRDFQGGVFGPNVVASASARILEWPSADARTVDDVHPAVDHGDYTLVVYCFGAGRVSIMLRIGPTVGERVEACGDAGGPPQISVAGAAGRMEVRVSAIDTETVAVSYGVFRD